MKRSLQILVALVLVFSLTACDAITDFHQGSQQTRPTLVEATVPPETPEEELFTVTLMLNGDSIQENTAFYAMFLNMDIYAQWNDGYSCVIAPFDENGVAKAAGLDGTYSVTLSDVPDDYIYDVNVYQATNDERKIVIDLYRLYDAEAESYAEGNGVYYPYVKEFSFEGVYEIQIDSPDDTVYCRFMPGRNGVYVIESWESTIDDKVNPKVDIWNGSVAAAWFNYTLDDGGSSSKSGYTTNFRYEVSVDDSEIGNVFIFGVRATARDGVYPIKVKVAIRRIGSLEDRYYRQTMLPQEIIRQAFSGSGSMEKVGRSNNGRFLYDTTMCRLWPVAEGGDGYYHLYDETLYASTGGWGPTLYANVGQFAESESLSVKKSNKFFDYRMFMRGFESLAEYRIVAIDTMTGDPIWGSELCSGLCTCVHTTLDSSSEPSGKVTLYACLEGCETCNEQCVMVPTVQHWGAVGYCEGANADGYYPVTEELRQFLQTYAENRNLFCDGTGSLEAEGYDADQDSMWLWGVIYYSGDQGGLCQMGEVIKQCFDRDPNEFPSVS